ncbi:MAG: hypothetical protein KGN36_10525 [Acidobacteriota bacterium]|nr:hypothetical protein [Acidobacteriota bacterium]
MDQLCKLQPHRTMHLQGFDDYGAAAALWGASDSGFTVSGVFRDLADFAVLVLFQKDDPFGHPLFSYLPDVTGLVLDFDVTWEGIQSWESLKNAWTDWNTLDCTVNGVGQKVPWFGTSSITITCNTTGRTGASATYTLNLNSPQPGDKVTLWYQNQSFVSPAISASHATTDQAMWWQGNAAYNHWVRIGSATYSCLEDSLNSAGVAGNIAAQINASDPNCTATTGGAYGNEIFITLKTGVAGPVAVSSSDGSAADSLSQVSAATILQSIAQQINAVNWVQNGPVFLSAAVVLPNQLVVTAAPGNASGMAFYDADTQAAAQSELGRALATFHTPNDDPSINGYADANFLRTRLYNYVAAIQSAVLAQCPSAVFELLWPMDVNDPDNCKLLRYINLPPQWTTRAGSGFDTFIIEGYQYPGIDHNLDQATRCAQYPWKELAWDQAHSRYLMGLYYGTWPWLREFVNVNRLGLPAIKLWAYDHLCLFGWPVPLPTTDDRSFIY